MQIAFERWGRGEGGGVIKKFAMIVSYERTGSFLQTLGILTKISEDYFLKIKRLLKEYQLF